MKVRIYKPSRSAMQSGPGKAKQWVIEAVTTSKRQPESLMGWISSEDTLNQIMIRRFDNAQEAIAHAEREGWEYSVGVAQERKVRPRNYMDNFKYIPPADEA